MHLQRLKSNQVDIPNSVMEMMVLLALPAKWDHVFAIYLQNKTAIGQVSLSEVCQAIVAEFDRTSGGNQQHAHCITAVKRKGEHPKFKGAQNYNNHSSAAQGEQGGSSKKKNKNKKSKGKGKAHSAICPDSPNPFTLAVAAVQVEPRLVITLQPSRAPPNMLHVTSFKPSGVTYSMAVAHGGSSFTGVPSEPGLSMLNSEHTRLKQLGIMPTTEQLKKLSLIKDHCKYMQDSPVVKAAIAAIIEDGPAKKFLKDILPLPVAYMPKFWNKKVRKQVVYKVGLASD